MRARELINRLQAHLTEYGDMRLTLREQSPTAYRLYIGALVRVEFRNRLEGNGKA